VIPLTEKETIWAHRLAKMGHSGEQIEEPDQSPAPEDAEIPVPWWVSAIMGTIIGIIIVALCGLVFYAIELFGG
jgi:hypothetical protein